MHFLYSFQVKAHINFLPHPLTQFSEAPFINWRLVFPDYCHLALPGWSEWVSERGWVGRSISYCSKVSFETLAEADNGFNDSARVLLKGLGRMNEWTILPTEQASKALFADKRGERKNRKKIACIVLDSFFLFIVFWKSVADVCVCVCRWKGYDGIFVIGMGDKSREMSLIIDSRVHKKLENISLSAFAGNNSERR